MDWLGRISKHNNAMLRALLYEAANSMLTVVRKAHPLERFLIILKREGFPVG